MRCCCVYSMSYCTITNVMCSAEELGNSPQQLFTVCSVGRICCMRLCERNTSTVGLGHLLAYRLNNAKCLCKCTCNSVVFTADDISVHHAAGVWSEWRIAAENSMIL